jgi:LacI family transcriptional regulator
MSATIRDVARQAGVSTATVSRHYNRSGPVGDEARRRIEAAARDLRYVPHGAARSLITSRTQTFGALLPDIYGEFFSEVLRGLDGAAQRAGYHLLVSSSHHDRQGVERALRDMRGRVDGLVVMAPDLDADLLRDNLPADLRVVLAGCLADGYPAVTIANYDGARQAMTHLMHGGHRRIAFVTGPAGNHDADERLRAYGDAVRAHGLDADAALVVSGDFSDTSGYRAGQHLATMANRPTAVFAANDAMAVAALGAFREAGLSVPGDVAVVGFDDIPMARYVTPPLTTVRTPIARLATCAVDVLLNDAVPPMRMALSTELVVRASCGTA